MQHQHVELSHINLVRHQHVVQKHVQHHVVEFLEVHLLLVVLHVVVIVHLNVHVDIQVLLEFIALVLRVVDIRHALHQHVECHHIILVLHQHVDTIVVEHQRVE